eukprot:6182018-Pleurochrysis_carterae.AAC.2
MPVDQRDKGETSNNSIASNAATAPVSITGTKLTVAGGRVGAGSRPYPLRPTCLHRSETPAVVHSALDPHALPWPTKLSLWTFR